jgi:aspartate aminotransferase
LVSYVEIVKLAGGVPVLVPSNEVDDFRPDLLAIRRAITAKTVAILINNPHNPTGAVYTKEDLVELADIALEHNLG